MLHTVKQVTRACLSLPKGDSRINGKLVGLWRTQQECFQEKRQVGQGKAFQEGAAILV